MGGGDDPLLGRRLPDHELVGDFGDADKSTAYEQLHDARFVLFDLAGNSRVRSIAAGYPRLRVVSAEAHADPWTGLDGVGAVLVRPDGYVAWVARGDVRTAALPAVLDRWLGPA
jgi:bifunctional hydroxylase/dehydrase